MLPSAAGLLIAGELGVLERLTERPGEAVHGRARRLEGERQARRHRPPAAPRRLAAHRRRDALHLPRRAGPPGRQEPARGGPDPRRAGLPAPAPSSSACGSSCRPTSWSPRPSPPTRTHETVAADAIESSSFGADAIGLDIGPDTAEAFAQRHRRLADRVLERPDGRLRVPGLRGRHEARRRGAHRGRRPLRRRRRRLRRGGAHARLRRGPVRPHLDGRRREPRVPRGQAAAGPRGARLGGGVHDAQTVHRRQLEDEPRPPAGHRARAEARVDAEGRAATTRRASRSRSSRRSPTCAACRR